MQNTSKAIIRCLRFFRSFVRSFSHNSSEDSALPDSLPGADLVIVIQPDRDRSRADV